MILGESVAQRDQPFELPTIRQPVVSGFRWFLKGYLRKHFHIVAAHLEQLDLSEITDSDSMVVYANHASWWDPLVAMYFAGRVFPSHRQYAPIDAEALAKYRMFARMGFYGVEQSTLRGAAEFLRRSVTILEHPGSAIWITPEGRFADVRDRRAELGGGLSHLAARLADRAARQPGGKRRVWYIPAAVEYTFWEERKPELLCQFGWPLCVTDPQQARNSLGDQAGSLDDKQAWQRLLTERLRSVQDALADAVIAREAGYFQVLLHSRSGTYGVYDVWRRVFNRLRGGQLDIDHGDKFRKSPPKD